jgi:hypothetical protein
MKNLLFLSILFFAVFFYACCDTHHGYGRYTLKVGCDEVIINGTAHKIITHNGELVIDGHTFSRGIYRKTRPWLYIHNIQNDMVDITFDEGGKEEYPLYTGSSGSIFSVYEHPWEMTRSTCALFENDYWLISHRWTEAGIYFDLQKKLGDNLSWQLVRENILVPTDGSEVNIDEINTKVRIIDGFNLTLLKANVQFIHY